MRTALLCLICAAVLPAQSLKIYAIDTEGGKATLYVTPNGENMLIDTGYDGEKNRDAKRIATVAAAAGVKRINHLVISHFHADHAGGLKQLLQRLPVDRIYDHGESVEKGSAMFRDYSKARRKLAHTILKAGDTVPVKGLQVEVVSADGTAIAKPLAGAGQPNPLCASFQKMEPDPGENAHSLALIITFGKLRISDLGDLYWNQEYDLACPANKLGTVDLYMTTHHGTKTSGPPQIVHALRPRVVLMNNGPDKGGSVEALTTIRKSPGLTDVWQLHYSKIAGSALNSAEQFIANPSKRLDDEWLEVTGEQDGTLTLKNHRNGFTKTYRR